MLHCRPTRQDQNQVPTLVICPTMEGPKYQYQETTHDGMASSSDRLLCSSSQLLTYSCCSLMMTMPNEDFVVSLAQCACKKFVLSPICPGNNTKRKCVWMCLCDFTHQTVGCLTKLVQVCCGMQLASSYKCLSVFFALRVFLRIGFVQCARVCMGRAV